MRSVTDYIRCNTCQKLHILNVYLTACPCGGKDFRVLRGPEETMQEFAARFAHAGITAGGAK